MKGPRIRELRERAGISQAEFARCLQLAGWNCDVLVVNRFELQKRSLADVEIEIVLGVLKLKWSELDARRLPKHHRPEP